MIAPVFECMDSRGGVYLSPPCIISAVPNSFRMKKENPDVVRVMLRLSTEYPGDLGILMPLVLNLLMLKTGKAFFMTVDEPHAYLRGDILEVLFMLSCVPR